MHGEGAGSGATTTTTATLDKTPPNSILAPSVREPEPTYTVQAGVDSEIFPAFANYASLQRPAERKTGTITVQVANHNAARLRNRISVQVPGWSDQEIQIVSLAPGEVRNVLFAPSFLPRLYANTEIAAATAVVSATDMSGATTFSTTVPVRLRSVDDMYWGDEFKYSRFIASWVTPHDPAVEEVLSKAKEFTAGRRLPGYEPWKPVDQQVQSTYDQAKAMYRALQEKGLSYVKSSITFGARTDISERIRMPYESLHQVSANCIDGVVMYASLFENLAMDSVVVLVPGHALVGVRSAPSGDKYLYIDTVLTGRADFETAVKTANETLAHFTPQQINRISITEARQAGIYPMPNPTVAAPAPAVLQAATQAN